MDTLYKSLALNDQFRILVVDGTGVVHEAQTRHETWPTATAALGRTLIASLLIASNLKNDEDLTVRIQGDGPLGFILTGADGNGNVRGYVQNPQTTLPLNDQGKLDVRGAVGETGFLSVTKDLQMVEPYTGQVPLISGELAEDFTYYMTVSEQTPSAFGLSVLVNPDGSVQTAGGFMIQTLPGASDEALDLIEGNLQDLPPIHELQRSGETALDLLDRLAGPGQYRVLTEEAVRYQCPCSKARFERGLASLPSEDLDLLIEEDGQAEAVCHFCNEKYLFSKEELIDIKKTSR